MQQYLQETPVASIIFLFTLVTSVYGLWGNPNINGRFMLHPYSIARRKHLYTFITSGLIHADLGHLLFNMLTYFFFAFQLERAIGHWQFAVLYIAGLILSDISTITKHKNNPNYYSLGASGAISAVVFSYILFFPTTKLYLFFIPIGIPAFIFGPLYLLYCAYAARQQFGRINHDAHFYGALTGLALTFLFYPGVLMHFVRALSGG